MGRVKELSGFIIYLTKKDLRERYNDPLNAVFSILLTPLIMLAVYAVVFSIIFPARIELTDNQSGFGVFSLVIFSGLIPYNLLTETMTRAPGGLDSVKFLVKKTIFPIDSVPLMIVSSALLNSMGQLIVLLLASAIILQSFTFSLLLLPFAYLCVGLLITGISFFIASLGAFFKSMTTYITLFLQVLFFGSPIFYTTNSIPQELRWIPELNPLTYIIRIYREALFHPGTLGFTEAAGVFLFCLFCALTGYWWFNKFKEDYAELL